MTAAQRRKSMPKDPVDACQQALAVFLANPFLPRPDDPAMVVVDPVRREALCLQAEAVLDMARVAYSRTAVWEVRLAIIRLTAALTRWWEQPEGTFPTAAHCAPILQATCGIHVALVNAFPLLAPATAPRLAQAG